MADQLPIEAIPLAEAVYCESCQCITRSKNGHCASCDGSAEAVIRVQILMEGWKGRAAG